MTWDWYITAAQNAWDAGNTQRTEQLLYSALEHATEYGDEDERYVYTLDRLVQTLSSMGKYANAEPICQQALDAKVKSLGESNQEVAASMNTLAGLYYNQGKYLQAEPLIRRALEVYQAALGPVDPLVGLTAANLAMLYHSLEKYEEADPLYRLAITIKIRELGQFHPQVTWLKTKHHAMKSVSGIEDVSDQIVTRTIPIMQRLERAIFKGDETSESPQKKTVNKPSQTGEQATLEKTRSRNNSCQYKIKRLEM